MPLQYELEALDQLISGSLNPNNILYGDSISDQQLQYLNGVLLQEKESVRRRLRKVTFSYSKEDHRRLYIQQHQSAITRLKNLLVEFISPKDASVFNEQQDDTNIVRIHKRCLAALQELMNYIRDEFEVYFNEEEKVPANWLLIIQQEFKPRITALRKCLLRNGHDKTLVELVLQSVITHCADNGRHGLTYRRFNYLESLLNALENLHLDEIQPSYYRVMPALLIYLNFNATGFKNYMVKLMHAEINATDTIAKKIETISFHHKEMSQLPVKQDTALYPSLRSVQLDVASWLFIEMSHLEKKQTLGIAAPIQFKEAEDQESEQGIYSMLTVEELALLFKALKETGILKNKNMKQVVRTVAEDWHTKQKENISWQYLYNSMSTLETSTINSLDSKLMDMVNWLRKMRGSVR